MSRPHPQSIPLQVGSGAPRVVRGQRSRVTLSSHQSLCGPRRRGIIITHCCKGCVAKVRWQSARHPTVADTLVGSDTSSLPGDEMRDVCRCRSVIDVRCTWHGGLGLQVCSASGGRSGAKKGTAGSVLLYDVPYSEHSSFDELKAFVDWLDPHQIVAAPVVGVENKDDDDSCERTKHVDVMLEWLMTC
eukprot:365785-Pyramimonas_sp.AAC.1